MMRKFYFVSYCAENGVFGYTFVDMNQRIHNWNLKDIQNFIEKKENLRSVVILNYKRVWWPSKEPIPPKGEK